MRYLLLLLMLVGCATGAPEGAWYRTGSTEQEFMQDRGACTAQAFAVPNVLRQAIILDSCMQGKGWVWVGK